MRTLSQILSYTCKSYTIRFRVARCSSKNDSQVLLWVSHGRTSHKAKSSLSKSRPGTYFDSCILFTLKRKMFALIVQDSNILNHGRVNPREVEILFSNTSIDLDSSLMHNDFTLSNCNVDNDKIVGLY
jgi:hypothetical protein